MFGLLLVVAMTFNLARAMVRAINNVPPAPAFRRLPDIEAPLASRHDDIERVPIEVVVGPPRSRSAPTPKGRGKGKGNKGKGKGKADNGIQPKPAWMTWYLYNAYRRIATALLGNNA